MDISSAALSPSRANISRTLFSALGSGGEHWSSISSDPWNYPPLEGDPWSYPGSDPEFSNVSSPETVSPSSSVMDYSSPESAMAVPSAAHTGLVERSCPSPQAASSSSCEESGYPSLRSRKKMRSRNPSRQRQCASEKEKLRMRDLTKALHHLRTYLPPSVAPAGQTLTKIQTLRLAIRYIEHLSAQVEAGEESLPQSRGGQECIFATQVCFPQQQSERFTLGQCWGALTQPSGGTDTNQAPWQRSPELPAYHGPQNSPYNSTYEDLFNSSIDSLQSPVHTTEAKQSYQEYGKDMTFHTISPKYWI